MMKMDENYNSFLKKRIVILSLLSIGIAGFFIRLYFEPQVPLTGDASNYFVYAADTALKGRVTEIYFLANSGWSLILSGLFSIIGLDDPISLMQSQRLLSIVISVVTIIPLYFLCRRFFNNYYSIIGVSLFIFEPHVVVNSTLGITEPIFLFFGITTITLFLSKNKINTYISFVVLGLFSIIRYEGLILFVTLTILYFIKFRHNRKNLLGYPLILIMFLLTILPVAYVNFEMHERDGFLSEFLDTGGYSYNVFVEGEIDEGDPIYGEKNNSNVQTFLSTGIKNTIWMFGLLLFPMLFIFTIIGTIFIIKEKKFFNIDFNRLTIILVSISMLIPVLYAYGRGLEDPRFLFMILPLVILISVYGISKWRIRKKNILMIAVIGVFFLVSFTYLDFKKIDYDHENELFQITKFVNERTNIINDDSVDFKYRTASGIIVDWPELPQAVGESHLDRKLDLLSTKGYNTLDEFIESSKSKNLEYIAVDGRINQPKFLHDVFYYDEKYTYLNKIFDSMDEEMNYHVKIFKIDFEVKNGK